MMILTSSTSAFDPEQKELRVFIGNRPYAIQLETYRLNNSQIQEKGEIGPLTSGMIFFALSVFADV
jgi:hypothetical protein